MECDDLDEIMRLSDADVKIRCNMIESETSILKSEINRIKSQLKILQDRTKENEDKIQLNKQLPYLVSNVIEVCILFKTVTHFKCLIHIIISIYVNIVFTNK